jgi:hypothetical protein
VEDDDENSNRRHIIFLCLLLRSTMMICFVMTRCGSPSMCFVSKRDSESAMIYEMTRTERRERERNKPKMSCVNISFDAKS